MPITEHTVKTRRHTTFYLAAGPENGPLVIFVHGWPEDANVYKFVKLLFRKGDPAPEGQRAFTATARRSHRFLGMSPIPDLPRDNDVVTEEDLSIYVSALERNGFFGPSSWYMNHGVNAEYAMTAQNGGSICPSYS